MPALLVILEELNPPVKPFACRRFSENSPSARHHGFFESNQNPLALPRSWQLYEHTSTRLLDHLKPFLLHLDKWYQTSFPFVYQAARPFLSKGLGLYGTIFTTCVVNLGGCQWHVDPSDKFFAFIFYLGSFEEGGELFLGPPINRKVTLKMGDLVGLFSSSLFHKANSPTTGVRWAIGCYTKPKKIETKCGKLIILEKYHNFLKK